MKLTELIAQLQRLQAEVSCDPEVEINGNVRFDLGVRELGTHGVLIIDEYDLEAEECCPGCGAAPGDGITESCNHPDGCDFYRSEQLAHLRDTDPAPGI